MAFFGQFIHFCVYAQHKMPPGAQKSPNHKQVSAGFSGFNLRILLRNSSIFGTFGTYSFGFVIPFIQILCNPFGYFSKIPTFLLPTYFRGFLGPELTKPDDRVGTCRYLSPVPCLFGCRCRCQVWVKFQAGTCTFHQSKYHA
jgi:hypothetical protein